MTHPNLSEVIQGKKSAKKCLCQSSILQPLFPLYPLRSPPSHSGPRQTPVKVSQSQSNSLFFAAAIPTRLVEFNPYDFSPAKNRRIVAVCGENARCPGALHIETA